MKILIKLILLFSFTNLSVLFGNCAPGTIIEPEFITVNDTLIVATTETVLDPVIDTLFHSSANSLIVSDDAEITTFVLVRHAEKESAGTDPVLTPEGIIRAEYLAKMLSKMMLDRVYSTNFNRTILTATPTAEDQGLTIINYGGFDHDDVINDVLESQSEGTVLIVGHGNTTPNFLNALTGTSDYKDLTENEYDNLYIVKTKSKGQSEVIHLKY